MSKFFRADELPADKEAVSWITTEDGSQTIKFHDTVRGAKLAYTKNRDKSISRGWHLIDGNERKHGLMLWC